MEFLLILAAVVAFALLCAFLPLAVEEGLSPGWALLRILAAILTASEHDD